MREDVIAQCGFVVMLGSMSDNRKLSDLVSVGKATLADFDQLRITSVAQLARQDADRLFARLQMIKGHQVDPCCHDVFRAAIEQAKDPRLPKEKCRWHYWSRVRKNGGNGKRVTLRKR
jgi:hypothetical protein